MYQELPFFKLKDITEILKCFLCLELNAEKALKYLKEEKEITYKYMHLVYETEIIGDANKKEFYSANESLITH